MACQNAMMNEQGSVTVGSAKITNLADYRIEHLQALEYAIRTSITVREDQEEPALPVHLEQAAHYGIHIEPGMTKGDLLNGVQTLLRATQTRHNAAGA
ncbi:hypothetical protein GCM10008066_30080 [Oxalicibacterium faecigallinarum]|uniref:Uncharacterized protein n=1 Tax=Oxalicibacterium faecigallinarum TaxID=573741 RepID=A0A8J3AT60_9BURK|nr:hypothetical protein GCM10008066_30080 [Oxalicibacterium faecigallinarum]